jgi:hypothetical protein
MGKRPSGDPRAFSPFSALLAFVLSAVLGLAFVATVNKAHELFARGECPQTTVLRAGSLDWQHLPSRFLSGTFCRRA